VLYPHARLRRVISNWNDRRRTSRARALLEDNRQAGMLELNSLHPIIDPSRCMGCAAWVRACPEKSIFGIIDGKAALIEPTMCVGHSACQAVCPTDAITLVFGTALRGVDIPILTPSFETNVPGIFIAGELGGMGLVKNGIEQGRQANPYGQFGWRPPRTDPQRISPAPAIHALARSDTFASGHFGTDQTAGSLQLHKCSRGARRAYSPENG